MSAPSTGLRRGRSAQHTANTTQKSTISPKTKVNNAKSTTSAGSKRKRQQVKDADEPSQSYEETKSPMKKASPVAKDTKRSKNSTVKSPKEQEHEEEKRLRKYRPKAPQNFQDVHARAVTQRMFVLDRKRTGTLDSPEETLEIAGSTGNIYTVVIGRIPRCDCPHHQKTRMPCKHMVYILDRTLKAPYDLQYQLALLTSELSNIFSNAPPIPSEDAHAAENNAGKQKPIEDDCPICYTPFDAHNDEVVFCKAACGNNIHKTCFEQWARASKGGVGRPGAVRCPFCRCDWQDSDKMGFQSIRDRGQKTEEGYLNVGAALGLNSQRDYSTYHWTFQNRQMAQARRGWR